MKKNVCIFALFLISSLHAMQEEDVDSHRVNWGYQAYTIARMGRLPFDAATNPVLAHKDAPSGKTGLMYAAENNDVSALTNLILAGVNKDQVDVHGQSALFYAIKASASLTTHCLFHFGASGGIRDISGHSAVDYCCSDFISLIWTHYVHQSPVCMSLESVVRSKRNQDDAELDGVDEKRLKGSLDDDIPSLSALASLSLSSHMHTDKAHE